MHKSSAKRLVHLKGTRLVLWFQGQTKLTSPSTASNEESILLILQLLAFTFFSFNTPFQLWQTICRAPQRPELWNCSHLQCSQKTSKQKPTTKKPTMFYFVSKIDKVKLLAFFQNTRECKILLEIVKILSFEPLLKLILVLAYLSLWNFQLH